MLCLGESLKEIHYIVLVSTWISFFLYLSPQWLSLQGGEDGLAKHRYVQLTHMPGSSEVDTPLDPASFLSLEIDVTLVVLTEST